MQCSVFFLFYIKLIRLTSVCDSAFAGIFFTVILIQIYNAAVYEFKYIGRLQLQYITILALLLQTILFRTPFEFQI